MTQPLLTLFEEIETLVKSLQEENQRLRRQLAESNQAKQKELLSQTTKLQQMVETLKKQEKSYEARLLQLKNQLGPPATNPAPASTEETPLPEKQHAAPKAELPAPPVSAASRPTTTQTTLPDSDSTTSSGFMSGAPNPSPSKPEVEDFFSSAKKITQQTIPDKALKPEEQREEKPVDSATAVPWESFVDEEDPFAEAAAKTGKGLSDEEFSTSPFSS